MWHVKRHCLLIGLLACACVAPCQGNSPECAVANAAVAGGVWAVNGCKTAGCEPGYQCNEQTERCDRVPCGGECNIDQRCDTVTDRCVSKYANTTSR